MAIGLKDVVCPPHINFAAFNQLDVPKEYVVSPYAGHSLPAEHHGMMMDYIRKMFNMD